MSRESSTAARSLRAVSLAITLVSLVTFSTVAYSAYQDLRVITSRQYGSDISLGSSFKDGTLLITVNATVPNKGLYPLSFDVAYSATAGGKLISSSSSRPVTVQPGQTTRAFFSSPIDFLRVGDQRLLTAMLVNGTSVRLTATVNASLVPFASVGLASNQTFNFAPLLGHLSIGPGSVSGMYIALPVSFVNEQSFALSGSTYIELLQQGSPVANSSEYILSVPAGEQFRTTLQLRILSQLHTGTLTGLLHLVIGGRDLVITTDVVVG